MAGAQRTMLLTAVAAMVGLVGLTEPAEDVVAAGDFETQDLTLSGPGGEALWQVFIHGESDASVEVVDGAGRAGSRALRYRKTDPGSQNIHVDQIVSVRPGAIYEVTAWVRGDGRVRPVVAMLTMAWKVLGAAVAKPSDQWQQLRFYMQSYEHEQLRFEWFPGATGKLYQGVAGTSFLDDVSVRRVADPSPALVDAFELVRPRVGEDIDLAAVTPGPVGKPRPLRPVTCRDGVLVYEDDGAEVALWGVNFQTALSWEYHVRLRRCGLPLNAATLKQITERNLDEAAHMGLGCLRLHLLPSDFSGPDGSVRDSVFLEALDHLLAQCRERGIYVYLTLMNEMNMNVQDGAFLIGHEREHWLTDPELVRLSERFVRDFLSRPNRYTQEPYAGDPAIAVIEICNEPRYVSFAELETDPRYAALRERFSGWCREHGFSAPSQIAYRCFRYELVRRYLERMVAAVRAAGCRKPVAWNLNWPRMIRDHEDVFQAVADSSIEVVSFCLYPGQSDVQAPFWKHPRDLSGTNYLPFLQQNWEQYERLRWVLGKRFAGKAKAVYEFETFYNQTAYMYPAMARLFRALGVQMANMWTYSLTPAAEYLSGSHHLNLYCTPPKAASFMIANQVFSRTPRHAAYAPGGDVNAAVFPNFAVSFEHNLSVLRTHDLLMHSRALDWNPLGLPQAVKQIVGVGSSPLVRYEGSGVYWVNVTDAAIHIRINPDAEFVRPPWDKQDGERWERVCRLDHSTSHLMTLMVPGWGDSARVLRLENGGEQPVPVTGDGLTFRAAPGRYRVEH